MSTTTNTPIPSVLNISNDHQRSVILAMALLWSPMNKERIAEITNVLHPQFRANPNNKLIKINVKATELIITELISLKIACEQDKHENENKYSRIYTLYVLNEPQRTEVHLWLVDQKQTKFLLDAYYNLLPDWYAYNEPRQFNDLTLPKSRFASGFFRLKIMHSAQNSTAVDPYINKDTIYQLAPTALNGPINNRLLTHIAPMWHDCVLDASLSYMLYGGHSVDASTLSEARRLLLPNPAKFRQLRYTYASILLLQEEYDVFHQVINGDTSDDSEALRICYQAIQGGWNEARNHFEVLLTRSRKKSTATYTRFIMNDVVFLIYVLTLIAENSTQSIQTLYKACLKQGGKRVAQLSAPWGSLACSAEILLGHSVQTQTPGWFPQALNEANNYWCCFHMFLLRAWIGSHRIPLITNNTYQIYINNFLEALKYSLKQNQFVLIYRILEVCEARYHEQTCAETLFFQPQTPHWQNVLNQFLGLCEIDTGKKPVETRTVWSINFNSDGLITSITPLEQKKNRNNAWGAPTPITLNRFRTQYANSPVDKPLISCIYSSELNAAALSLNLSTAAPTLAGHPYVVVNSDYSRFIEVVLASPEITIVHDNDAIKVTIVPRLPVSITEEREVLRSPLKSIVCILESADRLKIVQFNSEQCKAYFSIKDSLVIPQQNESLIKEALPTISRLFEVQPNHFTVSRHIDAQSGLRADLAPNGNGFDFRLLAIPLGIKGPGYSPGKGASEVFAPLDGDMVATVRDLEQESMQMEQIINALPFLDNYLVDPERPSWLVTDPEDALQLIEILQQRPELTLAWPKGATVKIHPANSASWKFTLASRQDWLEMNGQLHINEQLVVGLKHALHWVSEKHGRFIPLGNGQFLSLTEQLRSQLHDLASIADAKQQKSNSSSDEPILIPHIASLVIDDLIENSTVRMDTITRERLKSLSDAQSLEPTVPTTLNTQLRNYQVDGFIWAMRLAAAGFGGCLADDMGLGKTLQATAVLLARAAGGPALVIAPTSVCGNWMLELTRFAPTLNVVQFGIGDRAASIEQACSQSIIIVSYTLLQQSPELFNPVQWHTLIMDEAQAIKNHLTKRAQTIFDLNAQFRLALTGTPIENRLSELWSIMNFCTPGLLGSAHRFNQRFAAAIEKNHDLDRKHTLRRLISPFILRRTKSQVLQELPPRTELVLNVIPDEIEAAHYEALRRLAVESTSKAEFQNSAQSRFTILTKLTMLRRAACDPRLIAPETGITGVKIRTFIHLAQELSSNGHKALVFSQFVGFLQLLRSALDEIGLSYQYLDGSTPTETRTRSVQAFQEGVGDFFLISLKAGGFGLNLTAADYVIIADPWWNPAVEDQAMGRAHRIGQQRPVTVYRLVNQNTLEAGIMAMHADKRALTEGILAEGEGSSQLPSVEDLLSLLKSNT